MSRQEWGILRSLNDFVDLGADINKAGGTFETGPLNTAVSSGHIELVKYLLLLGAMMDLREPFMNSLFGAIYHGRLDIVKLLVEQGVDTTVKYTGENMDDMDTLKYATELEQFKITDLLARQMKEIKY